MEFKIDTKESYVLITPVTNHLNANLTDELCQKCNELTERGSLNFIIDLHNCIEAENEAFNGLTALHESCYNNNQSLVFTCLQDSVLKLIKADNMDGKINITPTVVEAVDIISMEILERDLFDEE